MISPTASDIARLRAVAARIMRGDQDLGDDLMGRAMEWAQERDIWGRGSDSVRILIGYMRKSRLSVLKSRAITFSQVYAMAAEDDEDGQPEDVLGWMGHSTPPAQDKIVDAKIAAANIPLLPPAHQKVMMLLCEGLSPLDISAETKVPVRTIIARIHDARRWISGEYLSQDPYRDLDELAQ